jgi:hypothetical protein
LKWLDAYWQTAREPGQPPEVKGVTALDLVNLAAVSIKSKRMARTMQVLA